MFQIVLRCSSSLGRLNCWRCFLVCSGGVVWVVEVVLVVFVRFPCFFVLSRVFFGGITLFSVVVVVLCGFTSFMCLLAL